MRMRYTILLLFTGYLAMVSCNKASSEGVPGVEGTPILLGSNVQFVNVTKAGSAYGPLDEWDAHEVFVYGIEHGSAGLNVQTGRYIDRISALAPAKEEGSEEKNLKGPIQLYNPKAADPEPFYYEGNKKYEFFATYVDDALLGDPAYSESSIVIPIKIDGTQDVMLATTNHAEDLANAREGSDVDETDLYSAYSARRDVHPNLVFQHQLSRFVFRIKTGFEDTDPRAGKIRIVGLSVNSHDEADMTVVGSEQGITEKGETTEIFLRRGSPGNLVILDKDNAINVTEKLDTLGEMMLFPGKEEYPVTLYLQQDGYSAQEVFKVSLNISFQTSSSEPQPEAETVAKAGTKYIVTMVIWGLQNVQSTVTMTEWEGGRSFYLDPDDIENNI